MIRMICCDPISNLHVKGRIELTETRIICMADVQDNRFRWPDFYENNSFVDWLQTRQSAWPDADARDQKKETRIWGVL